MPNKSAFFCIARDSRKLVGVCFPNSQTYHSHNTFGYSPDDLRSFRCLNEGSVCKTKTSPDAILITLLACRKITGKKIKYSSHPSPWNSGPDYVWMWFEMCNSAANKKE